MPSENNALDTRQADLINSIFGDVQFNSQGNDSSTSKGIKIYQNNLLMTATKALSLNYPVIEQMMGEEAMQLLTQYLLNRELPSTGDWADFGFKLPELIVSTPLHEEHPYLVDTALLEWNLNKAAKSAATELDVASLSRLSEADLTTVQLHLAKHLHVMQSSFQIDKLWRLHQSSEHKGTPDKEAILEILSQSSNSKDYFFLIYQKDHVPCLTRISKAEHKWFVSALSGDNLAQLLDKYPNFDFSQWLTQAIEHQWLSHLS